MPGSTLVANVFSPAFSKQTEPFGPLRTAMSTKLCSDGIISRSSLIDGAFLPKKPRKP